MDEFPADAQSARRPSLRRRLILHLGLIIVGLLVLGVAAILGINGLHGDVGHALAGYQRLRAAYEVGREAASARSALVANPPDLAAARADIRSALLHTETSPEIHSPELHAELSAAMANPTPASMDRVLGHLANLSAGIRTDIIAAQSEADRKRQVTLWTVIGVAGLVVIGGIVIGVQQYRAVMRPLRMLGGAVRTVAERNFDHPIQSTGDREFAALADDFNRMAEQLDALYRSLEQQVAIKSKELVRSERLASVGFLAAGVAHEINNPLGIITGYGERALRQLDAEANPATERTRKAIAVMCEEAYRCKQITDRLLSLARPGSESFSNLSLPGLVEEVVANVSALPEYRGRAVVIETDARGPLTVRARDGEIKQVLLNLLVNALEAVAPEHGRLDRPLVRVSISNAGDFVELAVTDNGRGMTPQTIDRVFEPFFTHKRGGTRGTGLGLSISHAIVTDHGGTIRAASDGPGRGSSFIVRLPVAAKGVEHVNS